MATPRRETLILMAIKFNGASFQFRLDSCIDGWVVGCLSQAVVDGNRASLLLPIEVDEVRYSCLGCLNRELCASASHCPEHYVRNSARWRYYVPVN
jgi:hypothetical protein